jgi:hypothetical protein
LPGGLSSANARTLGTIKDAANKLVVMMDVDFFMNTSVVVLHWKSRKRYTKT